LTTPKRGISKKTATRTITRLATKQVTKVIHQIIDNKPGQERFLGAQTQFIGRGPLRHARTSQGTTPAGVQVLTVQLCQSDETE
jgi:hypothetical protein